MANNIISDWLFDFADGADIPEDDETYDYAVKLNRLVEAARAIVDSDRQAIKELHAIGIYDQDESLTNAISAALRDIELPKESER